MIAIHRAFCGFYTPVFSVLVLLSLSFVGCPCGCFAASQEEGEMTVYVDPAKVNAVLYTLFKVNVSVAGADEPGIYSYEFQLHYDSAFLNAKAAQVPPDHMLKPVDPQLIFIVDPGTINQAGAYVSFAMTLLDLEPPKLGNGTLATITFRAEHLGASNLTVQHCIIVGPYSQIYQFIFLDGIVEIVLPDPNDDGKVDSSDLIIISDSFRSYPGHERWNPTCDFNEDFKINILDVAIVARAFGKTTEK